MTLLITDYNYCKVTSVEGGCQVGEPVRNPWATLSNCHAGRSEAAVCIHLREQISHFVERCFLTSFEMTGKKNRFLRTSEMTGKKKSFSGHSGMTGEGLFLSFVICHLSLRSFVINIPIILPLWSRPGKAEDDSRTGCLLGGGKKEEINTIQILIYI